MNCVMRLRHDDASMTQVLSASWEKALKVKPMTQTVRQGIFPMARLWRNDAFENWTIQP
jgi:hypothetical protein